jgi:myosin heavy subunit
MQYTHTGRGGEVFLKQLDKAAAVYARDACAKALYECVFLWVVRTVSDSLGRGADALPFIGVLDIFGFENFDKNELEQLLINFTNESLQDTFNKQVYMSVLSTVALSSVSTSSVSPRWTKLLAVSKLVTVQRESRSKPS